MPRGIYKRKTKRKTRGPNRTVLYLHEGTLYSKEELDDLIEDESLSHGDEVYACIGLYECSRGRMTLKPLPFKS